jgi:hypothetical protein
MAISMEEVAARQRNFFIGHADVMAQPDYRWQWEVRINVLAVVFNLLGLPLISKTTALRQLVMLSGS